MGLFKRKETVDATSSSGEAEAIQKKKRQHEHSIVDEKMDASNYINSQELEHIRDTLIQSHAGLVIKGMLDPEARKQLEDIIRKEYRVQTRGKEFLIKYVTSETVGTGVIEKILDHDESITDIGYNGEELIVESNDTKYIYSSDQDIDDNYVIRLVNKFANANNRDFTGKNPIFDGKFENIRVNAMYGTNTVGGVTMSLRIVRPKLMLTKASFDGFAPEYIYDFFEAVTQAKANMVLAGETGTGKTELQKLLASFIPFSQRIVLIEDVAETFLKDMFKDKDIYSWVTSPDVSITDLVKASLRNNPRWIVVSETRGKEAYEMIQAVLSGHSIITTLHAINGRAIPKRLINMAKMGYQFSEEGLEMDIRRYFDFGVHILRREHEGKVLRYLNEIVYFSEEGDRTIFKQDYINGKFVCQTSEIPKDVKRRLDNLGLYPESFKTYHAHERDITVKRREEREGLTRLDLSVTEGRELNDKELVNVVTEVVAIEGYDPEYVEPPKPVRKAKPTPKPDPTVEEKKKAMEIIEKAKQKDKAKPKVRPKQKTNAEQAQKEAQAILDAYRKKKEKLSADA